MLGAHQDAVVGEEVLRRLAPGEPPSALVMGRLVDRERARRADARRDVAAGVAPSPPPGEGARGLSAVALARRTPRAGRASEANGRATTGCAPSTRRAASRRRALPEVLAEIHCRRVSSSPYLRCMQTVEPLAAARGLAVEPAAELGEDRASRTAGALRHCSTPTRSPASTAASSTRSGSTCRSGRGPSRLFRETLERPEILRRGLAVGGFARGEQPRGGAFAEARRRASWNGASRSRVSSRRMIAPPASVARARGRRRP